MGCAVGGVSGIETERGVCEADDRGKRAEIYGRWVDYSFLLLLAPAF